MSKASSKLAVNNLRVLSCEMIEKAGSGHPGMCLSAAPIMYSLFANVLRYDGKNPKSLFRDRFVMSAGHGSALLYATLHMFGYDISLDDLGNFRQINGVTPGHPEVERTVGVDCSTGQLGQGIANAVGMAIEAKRFAARHSASKLFTNHVFCLCGDGCLMEGISYEAMALAGNLQLDNLVVIYDRNNKTIDGNVSNTSSEDVIERLKANNWNIYRVRNGNKIGALTKALWCARRRKKQPTIVVVDTLIGYGSDLENNEACHGAPLGRERLNNLKTKLGVATEGLQVLPEVQELCNQKAIKRKKELISREAHFEKYAKSHAKASADILNQINYNFNYNALDVLNNLQVDEEQAGRDINHQILNAVAPVCPSLVGGSADLARSTKAVIDGKYVSKNNFTARNIHYGAREFAMAAISNGIALYNGALPFCSTFLVFSDYMKPAIRMAAMMDLPVLYIFTHDSVTIGEDGPTHQPVEQLLALRSIPNVQVFRCYNAEEMKEAYRYYFTTRKPTVIVVSKQKYHAIKPEGVELSRGGYILQDQQRYDCTLVATGEDVNLALQAKEILANKIKLRVVSMPSVTLFKQQPERYRNSIINKDHKVVVLELASPIGWTEVVGEAALKLCIDHFGVSGKKDDVLDLIGLSPFKVAAKILEFVKGEKLEQPKTEPSKPEGAAELVEETKKTESDVLDFDVVDEEAATTEPVMDLAGLFNELEANNAEPAAPKKPAVSRKSTTAARSRSTTAARSKSTSAAKSRSSTAPKTTPKDIV